MKLSIVSFYDTFYLIVLIIALSTIVIAYTKLDKLKFRHFTNLGNNWKSGPVLNINNCNRIDDLILKEMWPGTVKGCYDKNLQIFRPGDCEPKNNENVINEIPYFYISVWREKALCGERIESSYLDLIIVNSEMECLHGYKSCGVVDSKNNLLCVQHDSLCPINYINFVDKYNPSIEDKIVELKGKFVEWSSFNISQGKIFVELKLSELIPCADSFFKNLQQKPFILELDYYKDKCYASINGKFFDDRYSFLDQYIKYDVYSDNKILNQLQQIPNFNTDIYNMPINLYYRNYIGISGSCHTKIKELNLTKSLIEDLLQFESKILDSLSLVKASISLLCFAFGIYFMIYLFITIKVCQDKISDHDVSIRAISTILPSFIIIISFAVTSANAKILFSLDSFNILNDKECIDNLTFDALNDSLINLICAKWLLLSSLLGNLFNFLSTFILMFVCCCK
jgi:hypothetical protein